MAAAVILLGNLFGIGVAIQESQNTETKYLLRNPYGEGAYEQNLKVQRGNKEQEISIYVEEETYGEEKKKQFLQEAMEYLEHWRKLVKQERFTIMWNFQRKSKTIQYSYPGVQRIPRF